jgi:hypothetical protein
VIGACASDSSPADIQGTAKLPDCSEAPAVDLDGTHWYDNGTIEILDAGCPDTSPGDTLTVCALDWVFSQSGNDVEITVDNEYRVNGRACGDKLHLQGGWWLPVMDSGATGCSYDEDSAEEVAIEAEGNELTVTAQQMSGTLVVKGSCRARYSVTFSKK